MRTFIVAVVFFITVTTAFAKTPWFDADASRQVLSAINWQNDNGDLRCGVLEQGKRPGNFELFSCFPSSGQSKKDVSRIKVDPGFVEMRVLPAIGDPLLMVHGTGSGWLFRVYVYDGSKVKQVWEEGSFAREEVFFADNQGGSLIIALSNPEWKTTEGGSREKVASTARIFEWTGSSFKKISEVPWEERFSAAAKAIANKSTK